MSECGYDNKQSDPNDEQGVNKVNVLDWLTEVQKGQQAQMKILKYLLKSDGSLFDGGTPRTRDSATRDAVLNLGLIPERILDKQQLPENALELPSNNQNLDLSNNTRMCAASKPRKPEEDGRYKSITTSPILLPEKAKLADESRIRRSSSLKLKLNPVKEDAKLDVHLSPRNVDFGHRSFAVDQKECYKKTESHVGEESVYASSTSLFHDNRQLLDSESSDSVTEVVPKNALAIMKESSRESTPPGHRKSLQQRFAEMEWDGKEDSLGGLSSGNIPTP